VQWKLSILAAALALSGCSTDPVEWGSIVYKGAPPEPVDVPAAGAYLPVVPAACPGSMRSARAGHFTFAAWWEVRNDSSAVLWASRSLDGGAWSPPVIADSVDHGVLGCGRPAPSIAADSVSGYVHLAYFAEPVGGGGVFFAHSMDSAKTFHSPVGIVFGKNPSRASVAASGDRVVIAYEDPNAVQPMIGLALSKTMGHIFEQRMQGTSGNSLARQPVVRIVRDSVRLWWSEYSANPTVSATRPMYREGKWN
jgi:hypothetical protein